MFDKIVIVLAESSLPRSSQTKMPTADACESTNPLACLELNLMSLANSPKRIRKDKWPRQGRKGSQDASSFPFFFYSNQGHTPLRQGNFRARESLYLRSPLTGQRPSIHTLRHMHTHVHMLTHSHTTNHTWRRDLEKEKHILCKERTDYRQELMRQNIVLLDWF